MNATGSGSIRRKHFDAALSRFVVMGLIILIVSLVFPTGIGGQAYGASSTQLQAGSIGNQKVDTASVSRTNVYTDNTNNCVKWARKQVPSLPSGLTTYQQKKQLCNVSGSSKPHVGDIAVMPAFSAANAAYGHVAVVTKVNGDKITIRESNYRKGWITQATGTKAQLKIYGYWCPKKGEAHKAQASSTTSSKANSLASIAEGEIGYQGHDASGKKPGDYTKYGQWMKNNNVQWCAEFVSWCANRAGISTKVVKKTASTRDMAVSSNSYRTMSTSTFKQLKRGDVIFFSTKSTIQAKNHVGIVTSVNVSKKQISVVEGNTVSPPDKVLKRTYTVDPSSRKIVGDKYSRYFCGYISVEGTTSSSASLAPVNCSFEFGLNGGTGSFSTLSTTHGKTIALSSAKPNKTGYVFIGWAAKRLGDQKWISDKGGWVESGSVSSNGGYRLYQPGKTLTIDNSWTKGYSGTNVKFRFYAQWRPVNSAIDYSLNGGSGSFGTTQCAYGSSFTVPSAQPTKTGNSFQGWAVKRLADQKWLSARGNWVDSGAVSSDGGYWLISNGATCTVGDAWYKGFSGSYSNYRLYAQWRPANSTVYYGLNGGSGSFATTQCAYDVGFNLPSNQPTKVGSSFQGWAVKRLADQKWLTTRNNWVDSGAVSSDGGYRLLSPGTRCTLGAAWYKGFSGSYSNYRFYAQWS